METISVNPTGSDIFFAVLKASVCVGLTLTGLIGIIWKWREVKMWRTKGRKKIDE